MNCPVHRPMEPPIIWTGTDCIQRVYRTEDSAPVPCLPPVTITIPTQAARPRRLSDNRLSSRLSSKPEILQTHNFDPSQIPPALQGALRTYYADAENFRFTPADTGHCFGKGRSIVRLLDYLTSYESGRIHPALRPVTVELLLFYFTKVEPRLPEFDRTWVKGEEQDSAGIKKCRDGYREIRSWRHPAFTNKLTYKMFFTCILQGFTMQGYGDPVLLWYRGLLRHNHIWLVVRVLEGLLENLRYLFDTGDDIRDEVRDIIVGASGMLEGLLYHDRFRSERLEILLVKYIKEEAVNYDVFRGVKEATALARRHERKETARERGDMKEFHRIENEYKVGKQRTF
ncbi:hypothetical protein BJ508DRAFT_311128 [Ascobolus immersus RN42]|uniref:Uncharacterized protein n=1 Tax=Ascobolus immersus RN42 TaxID=1160509 RepID=A0A3N4HX28_ASCIM|nr:hypothetical protein BJ508DRAFT_311128 [Ascobolus immersus RN42]